MTENKKHYETLEIEENATLEEIKKSYQISAAYSTLTDEEPGEYDLYNLEDALNELIGTKESLNLAAEIGKALLEQNADLQQKLQVEKLENNIREYHKENEKLKDNQDQDTQTLTELTEKIEELSKENKRLSGENKKLTAENQASSGENQETHSTNEEKEKLEQKLELAKKEARESQQAFEQLQKQELEA
ncbi:13843_t:CDS:2 [Funneliformis geosporum]|nr:13843_t:CDS:2 [Funneliformis geosporum]